jgi:hypothetical protein
MFIAGVLSGAVAGLSAEPAPQATAVGRATISVHGVSDLRGFSLVLVQGDMKSAGPGETVPAAAARALADMKDFLPFKSYVLLDTAWTVGSNGTIKTQLRQSDTQMYDVTLRAAVLPEFLGGSAAPLTTGGMVNITGFRMQKAGAGVGSGPDRANLENELRAQEQAIEAYRQQYAEASRRTGDSNKQAAAALQAKLQDMTQSATALRSAVEQASAKDALIDTSFRMKLGETVVVGTSRLQGDKALIVLVTAVGR